MKAGGQEGEGVQVFLLSCSDTGGDSSMEPLPLALAAIGCHYLV